MTPFTSSLFVTRRAEVQSAARFLLVGGVLHFAAALLALGPPEPTRDAFTLVAPMVALMPGETAQAAAGLVGLLLAALAVMVAVGLHNRQAWAPRSAVVIAGLGLLNAPFGTLASLLCLAFLAACTAGAPASGGRVRRARRHRDARATW